MIASKTKELNKILSGFSSFSDEEKTTCVRLVNSFRPDVFCKNTPKGLVSASLKPTPHMLGYNSAVHYCIMPADLSLLVIKDRVGTASDNIPILDVFPELEWKLNILKMEQALE